MNRIRRWWRAPIVIPRWLLTLMYVLFATIGVLGAISGMPTVAQLTWQAYATWWSILLGAAALIGAVTSIRADWEHVERWAATAVTALLAVYTVTALVLAFVHHDVGRWAGSIALVIVLLIPAARAAGLLVKTGVPHA